MDARELRIGNLLDRNGLVVKVGSNTILAIDDNPEILGKIYKPIPITEERLLKFGAKNPNLRPPFDYDRSINEPDYELEYYAANYDLNGVYFEEFENVLFFEGVMKNIMVARSKEDNHYYFVEEKTAADESQYLGKISAPIAFVHTFQNYYPAFSGEELCLKMSS